MNVASAPEIDALRLRTLSFTVRKLQKSLHAKAKAEPSFRFYSLWDKIYRSDVLAEAYRLCRQNKGAASDSRYINKADCIRDLIRDYVLEKRVMRARNKEDIEK